MRVVGPPKVRFVSDFARWYVWYFYLILIIAHYTVSLYIIISATNPAV